MAASSSDDSNAAPTDFDISSSLEDSNGKISIFTEQCPLCTKSKRAYYCKNCIRDGQFVRSTPARFKESFASKKVRLFKMTQNKLVALDQVNNLYAEKLKADELKSEISECKERIRLLKLVLKDTKDAMSNAKADIENGSKEVETRRKTIPMYVDKMKAMQDEKERYERKIMEQKMQYDECCSDLRVVIRENVDNLVNYIFPIVRLKPDDNAGDSFNEDTVSALAEASRTAYIRGRWVYSDNSQDGKYKIVEAIMPSNGDYSVYNEWVVLNRDSVPSSTTELSHRNAGSAISAGLTCACQLVSVLAFYLDVWLPKRLCYSEFCSQELNEHEFAYKVAKLNSNILHLCLSQEINPDRLHPRHTISNLVLLLSHETCQLGWHGAVEVNADLMRCMEESLLQDLDIIGCEDEENFQEDLDLFADWETVGPTQISDSSVVPNRVTMSAMPSPGSQPRLRQSPQPTDATMSVTGGLVSAAASVASWWRAAIGHK